MMVMKKSVSQLEVVYHDGLFAWYLENVRRLAPVKMRGPQKFASVPREVVIEALGRTA